MIELEQMRERHQTLLSGRVDLLGTVRHDDVKDVRRSLSTVGQADISHRS